MSQTPRSWWDEIVAICVRTRAKSHLSHMGCQQAAPASLGRRPLSLAVPAKIGKSTLAKRSECTVGSPVEGATVYSLSRQVRAVDVAVACSLRFLPTAA